MKIDKLEAAITEAVRFLEMAKKAEERLKSDSYAQFGCKETGAVRRASLDLTRSLAELRK